VTECSSCKRTWYSNHWASPGPIESHKNPHGLQCQKCRYTLCRDCLDHEELSPNDPIDKPMVVMDACPERHHGVLGSPVLATGRSDVTSIKPDRIEAVIVTRDGPIPPTMDEALDAVTRYVPLIADDALLIHIRPSKPGLMAEKSARDELALTRIHDLERDGVLAQGAWNRSELIFAKIHNVSAINYLLIVVGKSDTPAPSETAERAFILHGGDEPVADEVGKIIREFERDTGINLRGVVITSFGGGADEPSENIAKFLVLQLESEGKISAGALQRTVVRPTTVNGKRRIFAVVLSGKESPP
jgi:hypothetical protein